MRTSSIAMTIWDEAEKGLSGSYSFETGTANEAEGGATSRGADSSALTVQPPRHSGPSSRETETGPAGSCGTDLLCSSTLFPHSSSREDPALGLCRTIEAEPPSLKGPAASARAMLKEGGAARGEAAHAVAF